MRSMQHRKSVLVLLVVGSSLIYVYLRSDSSGDPFISIYKNYSSE